MAPTDWTRRSSAASAQRTAVILTAVAVISINVVLAYTLARATGMRWIELPAVAVWLLAVGSLAITGAAVILWRRYLRENRPPRGTL